MTHLQWSLVAALAATTWTGFAPSSATASGVVADTGFSAGRAGFQVKFKNLTAPYRVMALFAMPGEWIDLDVISPSPAHRYRVEATDGALMVRNVKRWRWQAPTVSGLYTITVVQLDTPDSITLHAFVMVPFSRVKNGYLNGYHIGEYPNAPLRQLPIYRRPRGFVEVTAENRDTPVSTHFRLGQFLCKQPARWPRYLVLNERLLLKLELLLQQANAAGHEAASFEIMSGYRTPYYNHLIGNVKYSRHVFGDAADIYIDEHPKDGTMDDLNGDGHVDYRDAKALYDLIDRLYGQPWYAPFVGGLGRYRKTPNHGPFVHVDTRGFRARWGS